ncbi:MAG TPA: HAD family hydrolase, partial [Acidimicrobiales bacterium]|nr:HAD family hydrolase [Acidimicrobiales bacterium]
MTGDIRLAVLDMAGTTVSDDGVVMAAFRQALDAVGGAPGGAGGKDPEEFLVKTMGQSKIEVFTELFGGDEAKAARANAAFEAAYGRSIANGALHPIPGAEETMAALRHAGVAVCLTTGFAPATRH